MMPKGCGLVLIVAAIAAMVALPAGAEDADAVNLLIRSLAPISDQSDLSATVPADVGDETIYLQPEASIDIEVYFERNSTSLDEAARQDLAALGQALSSSALTPYRYLVAGHTDASGAADFNQVLSEQRAGSVVEYLIENFAIDPQRLASVGWGESRLKSPEEPRAAINRRVEVTLIVPPGGYPAPADETVVPEGTDPEAYVAEPPAGEDTPSPGTLTTDESGRIKIAF
jgi:OmpA-OmpF porin, OOP family